MHLRFASLAAVASVLSVVACSGGGGGGPITVEDTGTPVEEDTGEVVLDSSIEDTGASPDTATTDTKVADTTTGDSAMPDGASDASTTCTETGAIETSTCGKCGKRARLCDMGKWLPWGACTGEMGVCTPAETRMSNCGKCGKRTETCSMTCGWEPGACTGEGLCNSGDVEVQYGACPIAKYVKTRTCSATCAWSDWSPCAPPIGWVDIAAAPAAFYGRHYAAAAWTGTEMVIYGGQSSGASYANDAAAYNPTTDTWRTLPSPTITGRYYPTGVWAGNQFIVWGGYGSGLPYSKADGSSWDPTSNTWTTLPSAPIGARDRHTAVWTGTEMIVWGGYLSYPGTYLADGAAYNPTTKTWRTIAAAPLSARYDHSAVFVNGKMIVFGGRGTACTSGCADAAAYDPVANSWTSLTPPSDLDGRYWLGSTIEPTAKTAIFWGGYGSYVSSSYARNTGAIFDTTTSTWKSITPPTEMVLPYSRRYHPAVWSSSTALFIWGGQGYNATGSALTTATGASYDYASGMWRAMSDTGALTGRYGASVVWTGAEAIIWGGYSYKNDGKIYRP